jgi:hypothetical protein
MRALIALVIVALLAGGARADDQYRRGRRKKQAAIALLVLGSAAVVASPAFIVLSWGRACPDGFPTPCGTSPLYYIGLSLLAGGAAAHGVGMPLFISGSNDIDRYRSATPPPTPVATVRF